MSSFLKISLHFSDAAGSRENPGNHRGFLFRQKRYERYRNDMNDIDIVLKTISKRYERYRYRFEKRYQNDMNDIDIVFEKRYRINGICVGGVWRQFRHRKRYRYRQSGGTFDIENDIDIGSLAALSILKTILKTILEYQLFCLSVSASFFKK